MNKSSETLRKVSAYLKKYKYVTLIIVIGIVLILIPPKESTSKEERVSATRSQYSFRWLPRSNCYLDTVHH